MIEIIFARYFSFSCPCFFYSPRSGLCCKPKYRANIIHHFIFVFFLYFFYHSSCRKKDQFPVSSFKFGTQVFTDPGLLKIRRTLTGLPWLWFCLPKLVYLLGNFPGSQVAGYRCTLLGGNSSISLAGSEKHKFFQAFSQNP